MKVKLTNNRRPTSRTDPALIVDGILPAGTVIDHPDAYKLAINGIGRPDDDECWAALELHGWTAENFESKFRPAALQQAKWERGIAEAAGLPRGNDDQTVIDGE